MKHFSITFCTFLILMLFSANQVSAQTTDTSAIYLIVKTDGQELTGKIISQDAREVLLETKTIGLVAIPKLSIKEIRLLKNEEIKGDGAYNPDQIFATRYFITTNGLPIKKGDMYAQLNLFGPEIQYGVTEDFGIGLMTSWIASPVVLSAKYSKKVGKNLNVGGGVLLGTGSWTFPNFMMALPFGVLTYGNRKSNINISVGYGAVSDKTYSYVIDPSTQTFTEIYKRETNGRALLSIAGMATISKKVTFVFDTFIIPDDGKQGDLEGLALIMPGLRFQTNSDRAFQIGFAGIISTYTEVNSQTGAKSKYRETVPVPIPMLTWFRNL